VFKKSNAESMIYLNVSDKTVLTTDLI